jgi:hypothetical protein
MENKGVDWSTNWDWRAESLPDFTPSAKHSPATEVNHHWKEKRRERHYYQDIWKLMGSGIN